MQTSERTQIEIEFNRFKQDCKKRALELAHSEHSGWQHRSATAIAASKELPGEPSIIELADKYYNWLILIPD